MSKEKYFSVDVSNDIHILNLHETLEQAKQSCLNGAAEAYEFASEMDDCENYEANDLPYAVYGVVLGRAKSDIRPLTSEEKESGYFEEVDNFIEQPELVETNGWISVKDKLPLSDEFVISNHAENSQHFRMARNADLRTAIDEAMKEMRGLNNATTN
ncbi:DUF551 domain-containing protein [Mannheimia haemolytica]|nr:DUF551 domain-containing protein [Mannheimia haemolytica]